MPVTGTASIVGNFGIKKHDEWNVVTNSNGIDIQAQKGAIIRSVFDGEVSKVFHSQVQILALLCGMVIIILSMPISMICM